MQKLIDEISAIVAKYGNDIVKEPRFVNILKDLCPDRDNPEKFKVLDVLITQGIITKLLGTKKSNVIPFVEKHSEKISKQSGYNKDTISQVLLAIAVATKRMSRDVYSAYINPPNQKPTNPNPSNPSPSPAQNQNDYKSGEVLALIWEFIGLCACPFIYLNLLTNGWWPFWAIVVIAVVGVVTIIPASVAVLGNDDDNTKTVNPVLAGAHFLITICFAIFLTLAPFIIHWTEDAFSSQYALLFGPASHSDFGSVTNSYESGFESPTILTLLLGAFCAMVAMVPFGLDGKSTKFNKIKSSPGFSSGATMAGVVLGLVTIICVSIPSIIKMSKEHQIEKENDNYNLAVQKVGELRNSRASQTMDFSFKDFFMGQGFEQCKAIIHTSSYTENRVEDLTYCSLKIDSINYNSVVDTLLCATTEWDNKEATLYLYFNSNKLIGIRFSVNQELDSLVSIYSKKYGKPEHLPLKDNNPSSIISISDRVNDKYTWTYKNGIIQIEEEYFSCYVTYLDRTAETMLQKIEAAKEAERQRQAQEAEQARIKAEELKRQKALEESKRQENNHKRAINEI